MEEILIATNNNYKREQFEYLLKDFNLKIKTLGDFNFNDKVDENKDTAVENARLKAQFWFEKTKLPTLGDDSGLEIDALNNEPGIKARRWGGLLRTYMTKNIRNFQTNYNDWKSNFQNIDRLIMITKQQYQQ